MVAQERINVRETAGRKSNYKLSFFSMYFVRKNEEILLSFKNSEKYRTQALNNLSPSVFNTWFSFSPDQHNYETSSSTQGNLIKCFYKTKRYGEYSITVSAIDSWNKIQKQLKDLLLRDLSPNTIKTIVSDL